MQDHPEQKRGFTIQRGRFDLTPKSLQTRREREVASDNQMNNVLVINSSHLMAKEITLQLTLHMPGCSIMYAPTIELARHILSRRSVSLVVSSPVLPDGGIEKIKSKLLELDQPPDLVVVQAFEKLNLHELRKRTRFEVAALSELAQGSTESGKAGQQSEPAPEANPIKSLGADIRNDLNNPLQEIVAMVYVAKASKEVADGTLQALQAIDLAAKNMAQYVNCLEQKIKAAIS